MLFVLDTQQNEFLINLGTFKNNYFLPKLLESYGIVSLVCTSQKAIKFYEVEVDVQKGPLRFRGKVHNRCVSFIHFTFSSIVFI